jgi:C4-dicarboxylate transporter DctQ subunit
MKILDKIEEAFIAVTLLVATMLVTINVVMRWMNLGTTWSEELTRYLLIAMTFIGMSVCAKYSDHVGVDLVPMLSKGKVKIVIHGIIYVICIIFSLLFTWYGLELMQNVKGTSQLTPSLGIPMYIIYILLPIGGLLTTIRYLQHFFALLKTPTALLTETRKGNGAL